MTGPKYKVKTGLVGITVENMDAAASGKPPPEPAEDGRGVEAAEPTRTKSHVASEVSSAESTAAASRRTVDAATKEELGRGLKNVR